MKAITCSFGAALLLFACGPAARDDGGDSDGDSDQGTDDADDGADDSTPNPEKKCNKMDIIFVVDDSASMDAEQGNLASNFPMFASILSSYVTADGDPLDYRIAVTTTGKTFTTTVNGMFPITEQGDNGAFKNTCGLSKRWIEPIDPNMESTLTCRANVGIEGPGIEMPLMTTKLALTDRMNDGTNTGFLREDALLAIVVLTDEDDSSTTATMADLSVSNPNPPTDWNPPDMVAFLDGLKGGRTHWAAGVIAGDPPTGQDACSGAFGDAVRATRLKQFVDLANAGGSPQAVFSSICQGDLSSGLMSALATFQNACESIVY